MSENVHNKWDLKQMQSLPLECKVVMTKQRIKEWYESWKRYEIHNLKTDKVRYVTYASKEWDDTPQISEDEFIESVYDGQVYVSWSGGKDSTVLKHIVDSMYDDVPSVFINTGLEYPEIQKLVLDTKNGKYDCFNSNIEILRPEMRFDEVLKTYGYPVASKEVSQIVYEAKNFADGKVKNKRVQQLNGAFYDKDGKLSPYNCKKWSFLLDADFPISHKCCQIMKKNPSHKYEKETGKKALTGMMAEESRLRLQQWIRNGCNAYNGKPKSNPMSFWTEQDVLEYIKTRNVPYASVYGDIVEENQLNGQMCMTECHSKLKTTGVSRTGCIFCAFGVQCEKSPNRFQQLKVTHPVQYKYCMENLNMKHVLEYIGVEYE